MAAYVTGRAFDPLISLGDAKGWDQESLLEGLGITEAEVRDTRAQIPWFVFVQYAERFEEKLGGPSAMSELASVLVPSFEPMARFIGFFANPELIYTVINRWGGPSIFPCVSHRSRAIDDDSIEITVIIPEELAPSPTFLRITGEMFRNAPCLVGGPPAAVDAVIGPREGTFVVQLPPSTTLWARVSRAFRAFFSGAAVLDELVNQHDRLLLSFEDLQDTHRDLERSEANFRTLIEQTPEGVIVVENDVVLYANDAMQSFLHCGEGTELRDARISQFLVNRSALQKFVERSRSVGESGQEIEFLCPDDEIVVGEVKAIDVEWDNREALLLVVSDVTERNRIMDRAMQLDRMIAVGTLAAGVAHEINNPLAFVHSNMEYAVEVIEELRAQVGEAPARRLLLVSEALDESIEGTSRVRDIVRDLKSFSREPEETRVPVDPREVVKSAINMGWHEIRTKAKVRTEYDDVPRVLANSGRLGQVVLNLVVNAAQAMPDRRKEHNFITIRTIAGEERGIIEVEDNGNGIPHENLRRIFDPFFTTKKLGEGTGLGLWISSNIINKFGGEMTVESEVGRGTLFRVQLPYASMMDVEGPPELDVAAVPFPQPPIEEPEPDGPISTPSFRRKTERRVLVVDDEPMIVRLIERVLPDEVVAFTDPHQAMRHLRDDADFDVVVCDATMPGMNGTEFYGRLKAEYPDLATRFLLVTGGLTTSWEGEVDSPRILTKPFNMERLRATVREVAAEAKQLDEASSIH